jgi:hypothetical protein
MPRPELARSSAHIASARARTTSFIRAPEHRCSLFKEGTHALGVIGAAARFGLQVLFEIELRCQRVVADAANMRFIAASASVGWSRDAR